MQTSNTDSSSRFSLPAWTEKIVGRAYIPTGSFVTPTSDRKNGTKATVPSSGSRPSFVFSKRSNRIHHAPILPVQPQNTPKPLEKPSLPRPNCELRYKTVEYSSSGPNLVMMMTHHDHSESAKSSRCPSAEPDELEAAITLACILNRNVQD